MSLQPVIVTAKHGGKIRRYEATKVWSMYGRVRVQLTAGVDPEDVKLSNTVANHFTRWGALKFAGQVALRALDPRSL